MEWILGLAVLYVIFILIPGMGIYMNENMDMQRRILHKLNEKESQASDKEYY